MTFHPEFEGLVRFASSGALDAEIRAAKAEYVHRTGDLFESDPGFERRINGFIEWYVLDRYVSSASHATPAKLYIEAVGEKQTTPELTRLRDLYRTVLSLYELRRDRAGTLSITELLGGQRYEVEAREGLAITIGDIFEARLVPLGPSYGFSDAFCVHPRAARRYVRRAVALVRKELGERMSAQHRIDFVHRVAYLTNRCERYAHLAVKDVFMELNNHQSATIQATT